MVQIVSMDAMVSKFEFRDFHDKSRTFLAFIYSIYWKFQVCLGARSTITQKCVNNFLKFEYRLNISSFIIHQANLKLLSSRIITWGQIQISVTINSQSQSDRPLIATDADVLR